MQRQITEEDIAHAKKVVNEFYNGLANVQAFNRAIEVFNECKPNGTFEDLKKWAKEK